MVPVHFELCLKDKAVSLRLSEALLDAVKRAAVRQGIPYQRFMRQAIEQAVMPEKPHGCDLAQGSSERGWTARQMTKFARFVL
jgi:hypothetical protein